jgi:hypothetical protein
MKSIKVFGLALAAAVVLSGVSAATSSANPFCMKVVAPAEGEGRYTNDSCSGSPFPGGEYALVNWEPGRGLGGGVFCLKSFIAGEGHWTMSNCMGTTSPFEYVKVKLMGGLDVFVAKNFPVSVTIKSGETTMDAPTAKITVKCKSDKGEGEIASEHLADIKAITYENCTVTKESCKAELASIKTNELSGTIVLVASTEASSERGLLLKPKSGAGFAKIEKTSCSPATEVTGEVVGEIKPVGEAKSSGEVVFKVSSEKQTIKKVKVMESEGAEKEVKPKLEAFGSTAALEGTEENAFGEEIALT